MAFHQFANGELLTAQKVNDYLMRQAVIRVENATERDDIPTPDEGMIVYVESLTELQIFDGADWVTLIPDVVVPDVVTGTKNVTSYTSTGNVSTTFYWGQFVVTFGVTFEDPPAVTCDCTTAGAVAWTQILAVTETTMTVRVIRAAGVMGTLDFLWGATGVIA